MSRERWRNPNRADRCPACGGHTTNDYHRCDTCIRSDINDQQLPLGDRDGNTAA